MKLNKNFLLHNNGQETFLVPTGSTGFSGIVKGNKTLGAILELLKRETSREEIVSAMKQRFDAPEEVIEADMEKALEELRKIGALDE